MTDDFRNKIKPCMDISADTAQYNVYVVRFANYILYITYTNGVRHRIKAAMWQKSSKFYVRKLCTSIGNINL